MAIRSKSRRSTPAAPTHESRPVDDAPGGPGPVAAVFRSVIDMAISLLMVVVAVVVIVGAFGHSPLVGVVTTLGVLVVGYFAVR